MAPFFLGHGVDALDFVVDGFFMKLLHTSNVDTVKEYRIFSVLICVVIFSKEGPKINQRLCQNQQNIMCQTK